MRINILGYNYSVIGGRTTLEMGGNVGIANFDLNTLEIASDIPDAMRVSTLLHEVIEAINYHLELNLQHQQIMGLEVGLNMALFNKHISLHDLLEER